MLICIFICINWKHMKVHFYISNHSMNMSTRDYEMIIFGRKMNIDKLTILFCYIQDQARETYLKSHKTYSIIDEILTNFPLHSDTFKVYFNHFLKMVFRRWLSFCSINWLSRNHYVQHVCVGNSITNTVLQLTQALWTIGLPQRLRISPRQIFADSWIWWACCHSKLPFKEMRLSGKSSRKRAIGHSFREPCEVWEEKIIWT